MTEVFYFFQRGVGDHRHVFFTFSLFSKPTGTDMHRRVKSIGVTVEVLWNYSCCQGKIVEKAARVCGHYDRNSFIINKLPLSTVLWMLCTLNVAGVDNTGPEDRFRKPKKGSRRRAESPFRKPLILNSVTG